MAPKFGTSGLRGLVVELTDDLVADYTRAFLAVVPQGERVWIGRDLRASSPRLAAAVAATVRAAGLTAVDAGVLPTPALAMAAMAAGEAAVMVTGSHIPDDRNGLKFYAPSGEIGKADEAAMLAALGSDPVRPQGGKGASGAFEDRTGGAPVRPQAGDGALLRADAGDLVRADAGDAYARRYLAAFGAGALSRLRIGVYEHSSAARDLLGAILAGLGAEVVALARADRFVPVDTEAVDAATRERLAGWAAQHGLDALVSTDGDADRPMVADAAGRVLPGDILGQIAARALGAGVVVTPVSSNTGVAAMGPDVIRTRIGSPHVIAGMEEALAADPAARVVGYEANGGFLLGFEATGPAGPLPPLMTRDAVLPMLAALHAARGEGLAALWAQMPGRVTAADRLQGIETAAAQALLARLDDPAARAAFLDGLDLGAEAQVDRTDGLRAIFESGDIVHLRPSGNAPEFRAYAEAAAPERAQALLAGLLSRIAAALGTAGGKESP